jgi:short-subunit dehydrogenase
VEDLRGKVAIITGGANGMGEAVSRTLALRGTRVVIADIDVERAARVAAEIQASGGDAVSIPTDVGEEAQVIALVERVMADYGRIDILDNNAAALELIAEDPDIVMLESRILEGTLRVNLMGAFYGCKYVIPHMIAGGGGSIINMGSVSGISGEPRLSAYGISKGAIMQLTRAVAAQYGKQGVRCNSVAPGFVLTENTNVWTPTEFKDNYIRHSMTPHIGMPQDVANLVVFLASDLSRYMTGHIVYADGGLSAALPTLADAR